MGNAFHWLLVVVATVVGIGVVALGVTWALTPTTNSVLRRVAAIDQAHHSPELRPGRVPRQLAEALISIEDEQFYQDDGVNLQGLARAAIYDVTHRCECQGGSTITEELAQDVYMGGSDRSIPGRWEDIVLALKLSSHLSKAQVLAAFLSQVYLGNGAYGAPAASELYFHQPLARDDLAQYALLAGLPQDPAGLDPLLHPAAARYRRAAVLRQMVADHYITGAQATRAERAPV